MHLKPEGSDEVSVVVEKEKGLRGNREDAECLKIAIRLSGGQTSVCSIYFMAIHAQENDLKSKVGDVSHVQLTLK